MNEDEINTDEEIAALDDKLADQYGYPEPEKKDSLIVLPHEVQERNQAIEQRAIVIEVGKHAWHDEPEPRAYPGMKVLVSKFFRF